MKNQKNMESNLDIEKIIQDYDINQKALAEYLFPGNQFAVMALKRILKGEALLNSDQLIRLSEFTGIPIDQIFSGKWKASSSKETPEIVLYERGKYKAELNMETWSTRLMKEGVEVDTLIHGKKLALKDYLANLDEIIEKS